MILISSSRLITITALFYFYGVSSAFAFYHRNHQCYGRRSITKCFTKNENLNEERFSIDRRSLFSSAASSLTAFTAAVVAFPSSAQATITKESNWPLWTALPVAPFNRRRTIRYQVAPGVYAFDQMIGIYYVRKSKHIFSF